MALSSDRIVHRARLSLTRRLSTGTKMFLVLTAALLPLGLIALFASLQSANAKRLQREAPISSAPI